MMATMTSTNQTDTFTALLQRMTPAALSAFAKALIQRELELADSPGQRAILMLTLSIVPPEGIVAESRDGFAILCRKLLDDCMMAAMIRLKVQYPGISADAGAGIMTGIANWGAEIATLALQHTAPSPTSN
jgi:hypothetical protein